MVAVGLAVGAAYLSRRYFEERFLQLKDRLVPHTTAIADAELPNVVVESPASRQLSKDTGRPLQFSDVRDG